MKNSIFKSYSKKILKSEAFVSVIIVFVLAIGIISTSYALYMDVDKDTDYQLVQVGDLSIGFDRGDNTISLSNMTPSDDDIALKQTDNIFSFYIYNTGTYTADYNIKLVTTDGNEVDKQYINYKICKDNANNCDDTKTLSDTTDEIIYSDELSPKKSGDATNPSSYYFIRIWINNKYTDTTSKNIKLKVVIDATNANGVLDSKNTLAGKLLSDTRIKMNNDTPDFTIVENEEKGLYKAPDDFGISYYFRGRTSYNYVSFAGFNWQVVRINGDGSVKLLKVDKIGNSNYNSTQYLTTDIGYMYGLSETTDENRCLILENNNVVVGTNTNETSCTSTSVKGKWTTTAYEATHVNLKSSLIKNVIDEWYLTDISGKLDDNNRPYKEYLADILFCNDKTPMEGYTGYDNTQTTYYEGHDRIRNSKPSLICAKNSKYNYSRFTVNEQVLKNGNKTNGDLDYPIGLLTADELIYAGLTFSNESASNTFIVNSGWTLTAEGFYVSDTSKYSMMFHSNDNPYALWSNATANGKKVVRPVINLKKEILVSGGDGTSSNPYTVTLN